MYIKFGILKMNQTSNILIDHLLWGMVFVWLIIDSITGFFMSNGAHIPLSQLFKLAILFFVAIRIYKYKHSFHLLCFVLLYVVFYILHLLLINVDIINPMLWLSKFLSIIFLYEYFRIYMFERPMKAMLNIQKALIIGWFIVAFNVIMGLMGYGNSSYGGDAEDMGVKGFFYAGNELGGIMAVLVPFMVYLVQVRLSGIRALFAYAIILLIGFSIGTKTCMLITLLSVIFVPLLNVTSTKKWIILLGWIIFIVVSYSSLIILFENSFSGLINRWTYSYNEGGILNLIFSGRHEFWAAKKDLFFQSSLITQLLGMGMEGKSIERDHLDALLIFGYWGEIIIVSFFFYLVVKAIRYRHNNSYVRIVIFSDLLILSVGYMAGHVWFSGMASVYIALINVLPFIHYKGMLFGSKEIVNKSKNYFANEYRI